ncbi:MAG: glycosyl hydrolase family 8 [Methylococcaceae bacterium]
MQYKFELLLASVVLLSGCGGSSETGEPVSGKPVTASSFNNTPSEAADPISSPNLESERQVVVPSIPSNNNSEGNQPETTERIINIPTAAAGDPVMPATDLPAIEPDVTTPEPEPEPAAEPEVATPEPEPASEPEIAETEPEPAAEPEIAETESEPAAEPEIAETEPEPVVEPEIAETEPEPVVEPEVETVTPKIRHPYPQHITYHQKSAVTAFSQTEMDAHVSDFYDRWKSSYLVKVGKDTVGNSLYRVAFGDKGTANYATTVSEGQGYGMLITVIMAGYDSLAREQFDGLWRFANKHKSHIDSGLMAWRVSNQSEAGDNDSAFDGDADIGYALLLAHRQWGSHGKVNYLKQAKAVMSSMASSTISLATHLPLLGDWHKGSTGKYNQFTTRTSDFMLANFRAFSAVVADPFWGKVLRASKQTLVDTQKNFSSNSGLPGDFLVKNTLGGGLMPAKPGLLEGGFDGEYYYNACRVPWRVGLDSLLSGDNQSTQVARKMSNWIAISTGGNPYGINAGYYINGTPIAEGNYFSTAFVAPFAVAAMTTPGQENWLNSIYTAIYNNHQGYYEDSINLLSLMVISGNFWSY